MENKYNYKKIRDFHSVQYKILCNMITNADMINSFNKWLLKHLETIVHTTHTMYAYLRNILFALLNAKAIEYLTIVFKVVIISAY